MPPSENVINEIERQPQQPSKEELEKFFDQKIAAYMEEAHVVGGSFAIVKDDQVIIAKGYGYADAEKKKSVTKDHLFQIGSIAKPITATALMKFVEEGEFDLQEDVNKYLTDIQLPQKDNRKITLHHLLTHTAGFEDRMPLHYQLTENAEDILSTKEMVNQRMPSLVTSPGAVHSYSNYGYTVIGALVEQASKQDFTKYMKQNLLHDLEMDTATYEVPLPKHLKEKAVNGYVYDDETGEYEDYSDVFVDYIAAGAVSASAEDMANFMMLHLNQGEFKGKQILKPETIEMMHNPQFHNHPNLEGVGYAFFENKRKGQGIIEHSGATSIFAANMMLMPEEGWGIYIAFNTSTGVIVANAIMDDFLDTYYPEFKLKQELYPLPEEKSKNWKVIIAFPG